METQQRGRCYRHVDFPKFSGRGTPMEADIDGVRQGLSELLQAVYTKPLGICCGFAAVMKLNFGISDLGKRRGEHPYRGEQLSIRGVRWSVSGFLQIAL